MKHMKSFLFAFILSAIACVEAATSTPAGFTDDYEAALKRAAAEKKQVFAVFSGSDWCHWCQKLEGEVLSKKEFTAAAAKFLVLLYVDSPQDKSLLSEKARAQNPGLCEKYAIRGYPTALLLDATGKKLAQTGYRAGGAEKYVSHLKTLEKTAPLMATLIEPLRAKFNTLFSKLMEEYGKSDDKAALVRKYLPQIEAVIAEAKKLKVPESLEEDRDKLVSRAEMIVNMVKSSNK